MVFRKTFTLLFYIYYIISAVASSKSEQKLIQNLLNDYSKHVRPVANPQDSLIVSINLSFLHLVEINEKSQTFTISIWFHQSWKDEHLKWNPQTYQNITSIHISAQTVWNPDIGIYNSIDKDYLVIKEDSTIQLLWDGTINMAPHLILKSRCSMDVTWFPYDSQKCSINFGSWTYANSELEIQNSPEMDVSQYTPNGEWELIEAKVIRNIAKFEMYPNETYTQVQYSFHIKRKTLYYFFNLVIPSGLIGFLAILGFTLPPDSGEKLTLGVTVLFSLIMFLNVIAQTCPANSDSIPLLGTYFTCIMFAIASSVVSTIVVNLNQRVIGPPKAMQGLTRKLLLNWIPWILFMEKIYEDEHEPNNSRSRSGSSKKKVSKVQDAANNEFISLTIQTSREWKYGALVVDRLCSLASIVFTIGAIIILFISSAK